MMIARGHGDIRLLLLSDCHLFGSKDRELFGVNTCHTLTRVCREAVRESPDIALTIVTGDISEDGTARSYRLFREITKDLPRPVIWMKGNHDDFSVIPHEIAQEKLKTSWTDGGWKLIFLDTSIPGRDEGELGPGETDRLRAFLESGKGSHILIFQHHPPVEVGSAFIDLLGLQNREPWWELVGRYGEVKGVVSGHVHNHYDLVVNGIRLLTVPSTAMQFKPGARMLSFDEPACGYRTLTLHPDGMVSTEVRMIRC